MNHSEPELTLHVGTMKSGTTYLQRVLMKLAGKLGQHGWSYPVIRPPSGACCNHESAFFGLVGPHIPWITSEKERLLRPTWDALDRVVRASRGSVLLSAESLAAMDADGISHVLDHLPRTPARVVITCRDLGRVIPSSWQQHVRNARLASFQEYLHDIAAAADEQMRGVDTDGFWRSYWLSGLVRRWADAVGVERIRIVTSPRSGAPEVLWRRFAEGCGMQESLSRAPVPELDDHDAHRSVGWATAVVMQQIASRLLARGDSLAAVRKRLIRIAQAAMESGRSGTRIRLPEEWIPRVREWARRDVEAASMSGVRIVGEWDDLLVPLDEVGGHPPTAEEIEAAWAVARRADPDV